MALFSLNSRDGCGEGLNVVDAQMGIVVAGGEVDVGLSVPTTNTPRSQSLPRSATPIYTHHQMVCLVAVLAGMVL